MQALDGVKLASFTRRGAALVIDFLAVALLFLVLVVGFWLLARILSGASLGFRTVRLSFSSQENESHLSEYLKDALLVFSYWGLLTFLTNGRTLGKWIMGIRVVSIIHERVGFWQSVERALGYLVSVAEFGFGFFQYFINPNRRTVHDRLAETIVIQERTREKLPKAEKLALEALD